jgi:hypothetical protein
MLGSQQDDEESTRSAPESDGCRKTGAKLAFQPGYAQIAGMPRTIPTGLPALTVGKRTIRHSPACETDGSQLDFASFAENERRIQASSTAVRANGKNERSGLSNGDSQRFLPPDGGGLEEGRCEGIQQ